MSRARGWVILGASLAVGAAAAVVWPSAAPRSSPEEVRQGRALFQRGVTVSGGRCGRSWGRKAWSCPGGPRRAPTATTPRGGERKKEGWQPLTHRAQSLSRTSGGHAGRPAGRPAYDVESLARAIQHGVDPAGRRLSIAMPHFVLSGQDMSVLAPYLRVLGEEKVPGVSSEALRVGVLLPLSGSRVSMGQDVRDVLQAAVEEVNAEGGVYRRKLELIVRGRARCWRGPGPVPGDRSRGAAERGSTPEQPCGGGGPPRADVPAGDGRAVRGGRLRAVLRAGRASASGHATRHGGRARGLALGRGGSGGCRGRVVGGGTRGDVAAQERDAARAPLLRGRARSGGGGGLASAGFALGDPVRGDALRVPVAGGEPWGASVNGRPSMPRSWWGDRVGSLPHPRWHDACASSAPCPWRPRCTPGTPSSSPSSRHSLPERRGVAQVSAYVSVKLLVEGLKRGGRVLPQPGWWRPGSP